MAIWKLEHLQIQLIPVQRQVLLHPGHICIRYVGLIQEPTPASAFISPRKDQISYLITIQVSISHKNLVLNAKNSLCEIHPNVNKNVSSLLTNDRSSFDRAGAKARGTFSAPDRNKAFRVDMLNVKPCLGLELSETRKKEKGQVLVDRCIGL